MDKLATNSIQLCTLSKIPTDSVQQGMLLVGAASCVYYFYPKLGIPVLIVTALGTHLAANFGTYYYEKRKLFGPKYEHSSKEISNMD